MDPVVHVDAASWPLLSIHFAGELTLADVDIFHGATEAALERNQPFGIVMIASPAYLESGRNTAVANKTMKWLKAQKPRLSAQCVGIATVIADDARRTAYAQIADQQGEKVYGCPLRTFATPAEAQAWLHQRLAHAAPTINATGAE